MEMTVFLLIRHGDTDAVGKILAGRKAGIHLNQRGKHQAELLAETLMPIKLNAVFTSPLERALETADPIARRQNLLPATCEALNEIEFGEWTGASFDRLNGDAVWARFNRFRSGTRIPGGEHAAEVQARITAKVQELSERFPAGTIALVSHADVIRNAVVYYAGIPIDSLLRIRISPASVSIISVNDSGPEVLCINRTEDLQAN
jgi:probable phosphoglycerate mutase